MTSRWQGRNSERRELDHRRIERDAADWLARRSDAGRAWALADQVALDAWLAQSAAHQVAFLRLEDVWLRGDRLKALAAGMPRGEVPAKGEWRQSAFFRHRAPGNVIRPAKSPPAEHIPARRLPGPHDLSATRFELRQRVDACRRDCRWRRARVALGIAMIAVLLVGGGWWYRGAPDQLQLASGLGATGPIPLADGSQATLSSDTRLQVTLSRSARSIDLQRGEAFFEVAKDERRPFVVSLGDTRVIALGTRFAVRGGDITRVVVTEGLVRLETSNGATGAPRYSVLLDAGAVATIRDGDLRVDSRTVEDAEQALGWRNGQIVLSRTWLDEAVAEFNRHNAVPIVIADPAIAQMQVDGSFRVGNAEGFVRLLERAFPVRVVRYANRIELYQQ